MFDWSLYPTLLCFSTPCAICFFVPSVVSLDMGETIVLFMCCDNIIVSKIVTCNRGTVERYCILRAL